MSIVVSKTRLPVTQWQTESGSVVSINNARRRDAKSAIVTLEPIQDTSGGDPSPTNLCPISGHSSVTAVRDGKNLFSNNIDDIAVINYGSTRNGYRMLIKPGTYTLKAEYNTETKPTTHYIYGKVTTIGLDLVKNVNIVTAGNYTSQTFTVTEDSYLFVYDGIQSDSISTTKSIFKKFNIQLELGSTASSFVPFTGTSIIVQLGQTVYGGSVDLVSGVGTVDTAIETITTCSNAHANYSMNKLGDYGSIKTLVEDNISVCNVLTGFVGVPSEMPEGQYVLVNSSVRNGAYIYFCFVGCRGSTQVQTRDNNRSKLTELNNAGTPMQVVYTLANPITFQLSPNQIQMLERYNTIWAEEGDISVTYARIHS